jgi:hypothetical protein
MTPLRKTNTATHRDSTSVFYAVRSDERTDGQQMVALAAAPWSKNARNGNENTHTASDLPARHILVMWPFRPSAEQSTYRKTRTGYWLAFQRRVLNAIKEKKTGNTSTPHTDTMRTFLFFFVG